MAKYFIGALVPMRGSDLYEGVRIGIHRSERAALVDMVAWAEEDIEESSLQGVADDVLRGMLDVSSEVQSWKVEEVSTDSDTASTLKARFRWLGTGEAIDFRHECVRLNDFYQSLTNCTCGRGEGKHHPNCPEWNEHVDNYEEDAGGVEMVLREFVADVKAAGGPRKVGKDWPDLIVTYNKALLLLRKEDRDEEEAQPHDV